jgi:hypothetical protein
MHKTKKTRRNYKHSKLRVKKTNPCKTGVTDEVVRIRRLAHEISVRNNKSAKLKQKMEK